MVVGMTVTPWALVTDVPATAREGIEDEELTGTLQAASDVLFALSGRRWSGLHERTTRVEPRACRCSASLGSFVSSAGVVHVWDTASGGPTGHSRTCWDDRRPELPDYPVVEVTAFTWVQPNGLPTIPFDQILVEDGRYLVYDTAPNMGWYDSRVWWPPGVFEVTYTYGQEPPAGGRRAAAAYGLQLALAAVGSRDCKLPSRVQTVTRQNVTLAMIDPLDYLDKGRTGLPGVDQWLASVNPHGLTQRPLVWSPDSPTRSVFRRPHNV